MTRTPRFKRIVVAIDFSAGAATTLVRLRALPLAATARLHLVHVIPVPTLAPLPTARQLANDEMEKLVRQAKRRFPRRRITTALSSGRPADEIARIARAERADLIVAGRRGAGGFPRLMLGSTAERLARLSSVPVLLVSDRPASYRRVTLALDVTEDVSAITKATLRLLPARRQIDVLHIYWVYGEGYLRLGGASDRTVARHSAMIRDQAAERLAPIVQSLTDAGMRASGRLMNGDPRRLVPRVVRTTKPDLVVLGNHARNAVSRALLGSVASEVLKSTARDVFLVPVA